ncbi:MAG: hypothetical protein E7404_03425 [Ruminococcaceae bacterium]|nr:hypothetical protein [Oscillospiraceae bacterium]
MKKRNILEETHSNVMLLSTAVSMILLTFIFFVYTRFFSQPSAIIPLYNTLLVLSFVSWGVGLIFALISKFKSVCFAEYSILASVMSVLFFTMRGVPFISSKHAAILTIAIIVLYWVISFVYHSFWHKINITKNTLDILTIVFLVIAFVLIAYFIYIASKMPFFSLWYKSTLY